MIHEHTVTLTGDAVESEGISGHLLRDLFDVLVQGAEQSLRFRLEGRSTARGTQPAWLRAASDFRMVELHRGQRMRSLKLEATSLVESMPGKFVQGQLFEDLDPRRSPLELFEDALEEALEAKADSGAFDQPLLKTCADFRVLLGAGLDSVEIKNGRTVRVDRDSIENVLRLAQVEYAQRRVRLAGRLDIIRYSDCRFTLVLANGEKVPGTAKELGAEALREGFGKNVVITGTAEFKPSGRLLRVEADFVEPATENEMRLFASVPRPLLAPAIAPAHGEKQGLAALLGQWPGEEPVEELLEQLRQLA